MNTVASYSPPVLELREVKRSFGGVRAVDGVTLAISEGAVVAVIGPNGAGKSTLFALLMGELELSGGAIRLDGRDMRGVSPEQRARLGVGRTFQAPRLFSGLSVAENIAIALLALRRRMAGTGVGGCSKTGDSRARAKEGLLRVCAREERGLLHARARESPKKELPTTPHQPHPPTRPPTREQAVRGALAEVGLAERAGLLAGALSQGERKRLELAMVLALEPRVLLLDEPTAGMGVRERARIMTLVMGAVRRRGLTMVFCEHDMETVFAHARRVVVMDRGTLIADGPPASVRVDPLVQEVYLGRHPGRPA